MDDCELLRRYVREKSEDAFRTLVRRHLDVVHGAALQQVAGDTHLAKDVVQRVFLTLARKAPGLCDTPVLIGWLYTAARLEALRVVRNEARRREREEKAMIMISPDTKDSADEMDWDALSGVLDQAMAGLGDSDREAVLLRFFSGRSYAEIAEVFALSEDGARKRVDRAVEKLRRGLRRRGIVSSAAALGTAINAHAAVPASPALLSALTAQAWTAASLGTAANLTFFMSLNKLSAALASVVLLTATGVLVSDISAQRQIAAEEAAVQRDLSTALEKQAALKAELAAATPPAPPAPAQPLPSATVASPTVTAALPKAAHTYYADPAYQRLAMEASLARHQLQFQRFYRQLGLSPDQMRRFEEIMTIQDQALLDAVVVREAGGDPQTVFRPSGRDWSAEMKALLGKDGFQQLEIYLRATSVRSFVDSLAGPTAAIGAPITLEQADRLAEIALANDPTYQSGKGTDPSNVKWDAVLPAATKILSAEQMETFQTMVGLWVQQKQVQRGLERRPTSTP